MGSPILLIIPLTSSKSTRHIQGQVMLSKSRLFLTPKVRTGGHKQRPPPNASTLPNLPVDSGPAIIRALCAAIQPIGVPWACIQKVALQGTISSSEHSPAQWPWLQRQHIFVNKPYSTYDCAIFSRATLLGGQVQHHVRVGPSQQCGTQPG